ncbi:carboxymuconolactone decarboxylase family protein [Streptoalloteichus hindustanus]|uniref:Alkylhydroperoxidase AhpD family core domain-containing protein n=1 Tax=Streptoalloteichus hindustanus TaxID=2017 RepID=A0A1M5FNB0_STRHI|nr:carboxymuconolactone decarboxylase family protein [Streptoalloteichus hindustanus]SHF92976.1 alkylhydroperoxidase AhpD family core domain-containing protein [Streptoalloteichus hindustanus]
MFPDHTPESAPPAARPAIAAVARKFGGHVPAAVGRLASSPELLNGFLKLNAIFESTTLPAVDREVLVMTVAARNGCHICVAMHTAALHGLSAPPELVAALRARSALPDPRLEALRTFVLTVMDTTGEVPDSALAAFTSAGYTAQNALEVVLGIGTYTLSTYANRLVRAPLDDAFADHAWHAAPVPA